jgi:hypothetical protein
LPLSDDDLLGRVDAVNLEYVLGEIQTDRGNLHVDGSPHVIRLRRTTLWHSMPGAGVVHHIKSDRELERIEVVGAWTTYSLARQP